MLVSWPGTGHFLRILPWRHDDTANRRAGISSHNQWLFGVRIDMRLCLGDRRKSFLDDCFGDVMQGVRHGRRRRTGDVHGLISASSEAHVRWILGSNSLGAIKQPWV